MSHSAHFLDQRAYAQRHTCPYCSAEPGQPCRDPRADRELEHQPAHLARLRAADMDPAQEVTR